MSILSRLPIWAKVLPVMAAVAGLAIIGSGITGDNAVKVNEPLIFNGVLSNVTKVDSDGGGKAAVVYNDQTSMIVSADTFPGDNYDLELVIENKSGEDQRHRVTIEAPEGFRFESTSTGPNVTVADVDNTHFVMTVDGEGESSDTVTFDADNNVWKLNVKVLPQVVPGFYSWSFTTEALATTTNFD